MLKNSKGFATSYALASIAILGIVSIVGYGAYYGIAKSTSNTNLRTQSANLLTQAAYTLVTESSDVDSDGFYEAPAMKTGVTPVPTGGGHIPDNSAAPKRDSWGTPIGYCSWDHGSINSSTGRITGNNPATMSNVVFAVISAGPDKVFNTTCAQLASGTVNGDDGARWINGNQIRQGVGGTVYYGDPVNTLAELSSLNTSTLRNGELRLVRSNNTVYRWNPTNSSWQEVSSVPTGYIIVGTTTIPPAGYTYLMPVQVGTTETWTTKAPISADRWGGGVAIVGNKIYYVGGRASSVPCFSTNEEYDPVTNTWTIKAPMPTARGWLGVASASNKIYAIGGRCDDPINQPYAVNEEYNPVTNTWATKAPLSTIREFLAASAVNNKIYVFGGNISGGLTNSVLEYNPATNAWTTMAPMPTARRSFTSAVVNGMIYAIGGTSGSGNAFAVNERYDPATNTWTTMAPMPTARYHVFAAAIGDKIYAMGGNISGVVASSLNEEYDTVTNTWTTKTPLPYAKVASSAVTFNNKVYVVGGTGGTATLEYNPMAPVIMHLHQKN